MYFIIDLPPRTKAAIALKVKKTFDYIISNAEEGKILRCNAWKNDSNAEMRIKAYQMVGFSEPQEGAMLGIVKNGKLVPYYPPFIKLLAKLTN